MTFSVTVNTLCMLHACTSVWAFTLWTLLVMCWIQEIYYQLWYCTVTV